MISFQKGKPNSLNSNWAEQARPQLESWLLLSGARRRNAWKVGSRDRWCDWGCGAAQDLQGLHSHRKNKGSSRDRKCIQDWGTLQRPLPLPCPLPTLVDLPINISLFSSSPSNHPKLWVVGTGYFPTAQQSGRTLHCFLHSETEQQRLGNSGPQKGLVQVFSVGRKHLWKPQAALVIPQITS